MEKEKVRKPTKKRVLENKKKAIEKEPTQKKPKKSSTVDGDEQWQKFIKHQDSGKKKSMTTTTTSNTSTNNNNEKKSKQEKKKKKKTNPLLKQREPCDLMRNEAKCLELAKQIEYVETINEENHQQKALAINLMPSRARQTSETLALGVEHHDVPPMAFNDIEFSIAMKRMNYERTAPTNTNNNGEQPTGSAAAAAAPRHHAYPLQDLMGDQGFFSINNEHVEHVLKCIIKDKRNDITYAKHIKAEAAKARSGNASALKGGKPGARGDTSNKKLNHIFGNNFHSHGYNRREPKARHKKMKALDKADMEARFRAFYKDDQLEDGDDETNYGKAPSNFKMFRKLRRDHGDKFARRSEILRDCATLTPKPDIEELSKEYILEFRQPPSSGDALCENGVRCIFNRFSPDRTAQYIGKVFYTEREKAQALKQQQQSQHIDDENDCDVTQVPPRFCIDCLLKNWTVQWKLNIRDGVIPERPINYFTVMCKPGQYSPHCMLSQLFNNKQTGIIGHVPRYSPNNRRIITHQRIRRYDNKHETISVPVLVETESVSTALFLSSNTGSIVNTPSWWDDFQLSFDESLIIDRHFLSDIESKVCIASIDEPLHPSGVKSTIESLRLILAQKFTNPSLNFRELPVSLLRLYFSGRQRLGRFISRLPLHRFNTLVHFLEQDGLSYQRSEQEQDIYTDPLYKQKALAIESYIKELLDYCLCSFEVTLSRIMQVLNDDNNDTSTKRWHRFGLLDALEHGSHWANFHIPDAVRNGSPREQRSYCLWLTCVWRINTSLSLCKLLSPWDDDQSKEWVSYQFKLFRDTHLDMLSMMFKHKVYDDEAVATQHHILRDFYPLCNRVCCAEELPDFVGYATDNFKTGSNLKERSSLDDKIGHLYVNKTGPNICKIRNFYDIIIRYGEEDPVIYDILKNVIKCVLLGNLPHSRGNLNMMALIELNLFFYPDEADAVIPEEEFKELTKNKSMKRNRSKKKTKDEVVYVKTKFILWLLLCRHFVLYLLKEFLFYIAESSEWLNELLSEDYKFIRYREIVLIGNGQCRNKLSQQAKKKAPGSPFDWSEIEFEEKSTETYDTKSGEIKKFHAWSLTVARKVQKDDFMKILAKKMTNTEETLHIATPYRPFYYVRSKGELPSEGRMIALDELHEICEYMSKNRSRIIESRWFQVIGMSRKGLETLRLWLFRYDKYDIPDNSLKNLIREFYSNSPIDYMILKTVIKVIEYYKQDQVFHLPLSYAKKQIFALRNLLGIEDWEPTPALLGYAYQCPGCLKFANTVIEPVDHTHKQCPAGSSSCSGGGDPTTTTTTKKTTGKGAPKKNTQIKGEAKKKGVDGRKTKGKETQDKKKKKKKKKDKSTASANAANSPTSCFLNMAFYDMDTCSLHCSKYSSNYKHTLLGDDLENGNIIMKSRDGSIIIRSNKTILLKPDGSPVDITNTSTSASRTTTKKSQSSSQASKEREAQKFQWLLERRVFEFNDANDGDDPSNDNITCGLYAAPEPVLEDDGETISPTELFTPRLAPKTAAKKSTKKKIFLNDVNRAISDMGLTCNKELQKVDMIGIIKNNHVFCTEPNCGSMTLACNYNSTNHGITCGKHKSVYDSNYDAEPSLSNPDKRSEAAATKKRDIADGANAIIMMGDSSPHYENDQMIENNTTPPPTMLISNNNNSIQSSQSVLYRHHQTTVTNQTLKSNLHPLDIVEKGKLFSPQSGHIEGERCAYCNVGGSKYRVSAMGYHRKILKIGLCKPCYDLCSVVINKHDFLPLSDVYNHLKSKKPLSI